MSPPIREGSGSSIGSIRLGDGSEIAEVRTGAGDVLFSAIPDTSMFQSPLYQFSAAKLNVADGTTGVTFPETLAGLSDPTVVGGPTFRENQDGFKAIEFDGSDHHEWTPDSNLPTGADPHSWAALVYLPALPSGEKFTVCGYGAGNTNETTTIQFDGFDSGKLLSTFFSGDIVGSVPSTNQWITVGVSYDGSNRTLYLDGSPDNSDSPGPINVQNANHTIAKAPFGGNRLDGFIAEVILCDAAESDQAFSDYHANRLL